MASDMGTWSSEAAAAGLSTVAILRRLGVMKDVCQKIVRWGDHDHHTVSTNMEYNRYCMLWFGILSLQTYNGRSLIALRFDDAKLNTVRTCEGFSSAQPPRSASWNDEFCRLHGE